MSDPKRPGASGSPVSEALASRTIRHISEHGIDNMSLRTVAAAAGVTTAAIVHHFKNKDGLLAASAHMALGEDRAQHAALLASLSGLRVDRQILADLIALYVELRCREQVISRFWSEILYRSRNYPKLRPMLREWHEMRVGFWQDVLELAGLDRGNADFVTSYGIAEETFSYALGAQASYGLLLREAARALAAALFGEAGALGESGSVSGWLRSRVTEFPIITALSQESLRDRLLSHAATEIHAKGIGVLNQRHLSRLADSSPSMIVYHFGDMNSFAQAAIWQALLRNLPAEFDPSKSGVDEREERAHWGERLALMIRPAVRTKEAGFYVGYSRLAGQAALLASHQPELIALIAHLRQLEGFGTYRLRSVIWPAAPRDVTYVQAELFGMWVKGAAVVNEAIRPDSPASKSDILRVAELIGR